MIKFENVFTTGWEPALRGMRNPKNSWGKADTSYYVPEGELYLVPKIGESDYDLAMRLVKGGPVHAKFRRMIVVYFDITAPLYWWKEFDTYKIGTVSNSCSTMHKIDERMLGMPDFSTEHLISFDEDDPQIDFEDQEVKDFYCSLAVKGTDCVFSPQGVMELVVQMLNRARYLYKKTGDKRYWWQMIQLLPSSYNQKRTIMANYEVLFDAYHSRKGHKLDEWSDTFCEMVEKLPYSEFITTVPARNEPTTDDILKLFKSEKAIIDAETAKRLAEYAIRKAHEFGIHEFQPYKEETK